MYFALVKLSVIIVNYNVKYFLEQALLSVRKAAQRVDTEVWVVDNNSVDGSAAMVQEKFPEVHLIANKENLGFSRANNQAIRKAKGEYILLLNPDTVVEESTFEKVVRFMDEHPDAGGLGVRMIDGKGIFLPESKRGLPTPQVAFFKLFGLARLFPKSKIFGRYHLKYLDEFATNEVEILSGAFMLLRKVTLDKTGLLDETFFMYGEDIDLSYRILKAGYKNYYFPETTIIHYKGESTKRTSVNYVFVFYRAMVIFAQKHYGGSKARLFSTMINAVIWIRALVALLWRFYDRTKYIAADALILFFVNWYVKHYWEDNHKYVEGGHYPEQYLYVNVLLYILFWITAIYLNGGYKKQSSIKSVIKGMFAGTVAIAVLYAFLPESLRYSRALIILGSIGGLLLLIVYRLLLQFIRYKNISLDVSGELRTVIVGEKTEVERVYQLLLNSRSPHKLVGFVAANADQGLAFPHLGRLEQLKEICKIYHIDEVIFCGHDVSAESIIHVMSTQGMEEVSYKIVPEQSVYIIGSNSKNAQGELYTIDLKLNLSDSDLRFQKRVFDIFCSLILILVFPVHLFFRRKPFRFIAQLFKVFAGKMTMVGYAPANNDQVLPELKPSVFTHLSGYRMSGTLEVAQANFFYARDYQVINDVEVVLRNLFSRG